LGGAGAMALAALTGVFAGLTALIGRSMHGAGGTGAAATIGGPSRSGSTPGSTSTAKHGSAQPSGQLPGRHLVAASEVPPGRAVRFTDDNGDPAWLLHEANGDFRAFSAVCTHAGCAV